MSTMMIDKKWDKVKLQELREALTRGRDAFLMAGQIVMEALSEGGLSLDELHQETEIPLDVLAQLERIGRGQLNPQLLLSDFPAARAMERLPMSEQNRILMEPVDLFVIKEGKPDHLKVPVATLTAKQARQVFSRNYVRPLHEQKNWLEGQQKQAAHQTIRRDVPYEITRRHTVIIGAVEFTVAELLRIAALAQE